MKTALIQLKVSGLMCSFCTVSVEKALKRLAGIRSVQVNLVHGIVLVEAEPNKVTPDELREVVERLGYGVSSTEAQQTRADEALYHSIKLRGAIGLVLAIVGLITDPLNLFGLRSGLRASVSLAIALIVLLWVGSPILKKTMLALRQGVINANVLLSAGAWGSLGVGCLALFRSGWPNFLPVAYWLMALHIFFGYFKLDTRKRASETVRKLLSLQPTVARVLRGELITNVPTKDLRAGEMIVVRPGERIPLDGEVTNGEAAVDESSFTGESTPVSKCPGSSVIGGSLNFDGGLTIRVTKPFEECFLSQIVGLMTRISERKPPVELLADRVMNYYGPAVFTLAVTAFLAWIVFTGDIKAATIVFLTSIIMGYPCALGVTTPLLAAFAGGKGLSGGILVKASEVLHGLSEIDAIAFDKTGTLTYGRPTVTDVIPFDVTRRELLLVAGAAEAHSEHPLAKAITFLAKKEISAIPAARDFRAVTGKGVLAKLEEADITIGKAAFFKELGMPVDGRCESHVAELEAAGKTTILISRNSRIIGILALQDIPRRDASHLTEQLRARGIRSVILTGDSLGVGNAIAKEVGVDEVRSELLPQEKAEAIAAMQKRGLKVAMVGDGVNDAPALAQADVGIAIGAGTDVAIESAGVILLSDQLTSILGALTLGKASARTLTTNVAIAILFNVVGIALAVFGLVTPVIAILIMAASILAILLNTMRIGTLPIRSHLQSSVETSSLAEAEFAVPKMHCDGCAEKIIAALSSVAGIVEVEAKVAQKRVYIQYEPDLLQRSALEQMLNKAGFRAIPV
jgi:P-type Cu+ transporter